jgi:hypothetical protein
MYKSYNKIKENEIEMIRFKDTIARFTFLQLAFGVYDYLIGKFIAKDIFDKTGLRLAHSGEEISTELLALLDRHKINEIRYSGDIVNSVICGIQYI